MVVCIEIYRQEWGITIDGWPHSQVVLILCRFSYLVDSWVIDKIPEKDAKFYVFKPHSTPTEKIRPFFFCQVECHCKLPTVSPALRFPTKPQMRHHHCSMFAGISNCVIFVSYTDLSIWNDWNVEFERLKCLCLVRMCKWIDHTHTNRQQKFPWNGNSEINHVQSKWYPAVSFYQCMVCGVCVCVCGHITDFNHTILLGDSH